MAVHKKIFVILLVTIYYYFFFFYGRKNIMHYTGCPIKNGTVDFQYIASRKLSIFLRHCIKYLPQKRMIPKSFNLVG